MALKIYTNESVPVAVAVGLKQRGVEAWSARDVGNLGLGDEEQLRYASRQRAVVFTHDEDFLRLAHEWTQQGREHWVLSTSMSRNSVLVSAFAASWTTR